MEAIIYLAIAFVPLFVIFFISRAIESAHFRVLEEEEKRYSHFLVSDVPYVTSQVDPAVTPRWVAGEVVISSSRIKDFFARWRNFFGGEIKSYQTLQERALRESRLRLLREAEAIGCDAICNTRFDATQLSIAAISNARGRIMVCMQASATAYKRKA